MTAESAGRVATPRERGGIDGAGREVGGGGGRKMRGIEGGEGSGGGDERLELLRDRVRPFIQRAAAWLMGVFGVLGVFGVGGVLVRVLL